MSCLSLARCVSRVGVARLGVSRTISCSATNRGDEVTHTGQSFAETDPRSARFSVTGLQKQVNPNWAIDLIAKVPPKVVKTRKVSCDGGGGALGHPRVYINLDPDGPQTCGYCGLRFVLDKDHH
jgi:NADH dehydrogenase (ubiquinone) Fe-S protein 6